VKKSAFLAVIINHFCKLVCLSFKVSRPFIKFTLTLFQGCL
jgi:hypothetical protein